MSVVSVFELEHGARTTARPDAHLKAVRDLYSGFTVLDFGLESSREAARIHRELLSNGMKLGQMDVFLAATALCHDLILVTHNTRHFARVPGLRIEDWQE